MKTKYLILILAGLIVSCTVNVQRNSVQREEWINDWINDPVCSPPCFESIIPGTTSIDDAYKQLKNDSSNYDVKLEDVDLYGNKYSLLSWAKNNTDGEIYYPGIISTDINSNRIVHQISLRFYAGDEYTQVNLGDLISKYGDPEYYINYHEQSACAYGVVFIDHGMIAILNLVPNSSIVDLTGSTQVQNLELLPLEIISKQNFGFQEEIENSVIWHGYGEYICK